MLAEAVDEEPKIAKLKKELKEIELLQKISDAKKKIAENEKNTLKAKLPDLEGKALEGKITVDNNVSIECSILTYKAVSEIAFQISLDIKKESPDTKNVVICNQDDFNALRSYNAVAMQIEIFKDQYKGVLESLKRKSSPHVSVPVPALSPDLDITSLSSPVSALASFSPLTVPLSFFNFVLDFALLFRKDTDIKSSKFDISDESLVSEISRALKLNDITATYPAFINTVQGGLLSNLLELSVLKENADREIERWSEDKSLKEEVALLKNLNSQYEKLLASLAFVDEKTGTGRLEKVLRGEILNAELNKPGTEILYLKIAAVGGNNKTTRNLLWSRLFHSGSAVITYFLLDKSGAIKASKTFYNTTGYKQFKNQGGTSDSNNFNRQ